MKYENGTWKLLNVDKLPRFESGSYKGKIDHKNCVGFTLKYELKVNRVIYEIKIVEYIKGYKDENDKRIDTKFKVKYVYLEDTEYEEVIEKTIHCGSLINEVNIGGIIPSLNQWVKKDNCWIGADTKGREFKFSTDSRETEYNILHSTWYVSNSVDNYVLTGSLNNTKQNWKLHRVIYFNCDKIESDKNIHNCIDHINNDRTDNRISNLRLVSQKENSKNKKTNNKHKLVGLAPHGKGYRSLFMFEGYMVSTKTKHDLEEAKLDNLMAQQHLGFKHNEDQFYKLNGLSEERIKEVIELLDKRIENNKHKIKKEKEYAYDFIEKDSLIGIKTFKRDGTPNEICWVDRDFGRIERDKFIVKGRIHKGNKGYFRINKNSINVYVMVGEMSLQNYRNDNFQIDHINQKTNENYRDNLEIVTDKSNKMNKKGKGYSEEDNKYRVQYAYTWEYFDLYIGGLKRPYFNTEEEAITEVKRRKEIVNKYRFRVKTLKEVDEIIDFAEEHELDVNDAYIVWKGLDTLENIKKYLKSIDK